MVERLKGGQVEMHERSFASAGDAHKAVGPALAATCYHSLADWRAAGGAALTGQTGPYDRWDWFERTGRLTGQADDPLVLSSGEAWLPLTRTGRRSARALASWYTLAFRPVFAGAPNALALLRLPTAARAAGLARLHLKPVPAWDGSADRLADAFRAAGWRADAREATGNWVHRVDGQSWNDFSADRPGKLRSTIARKARRASLTTEVHSAVTDDLWRDYAAVFDASWKEEEGSLPFLRELAEAAGPGLRLGFARLDGKAIATQLWTIDPSTDGPTATIHKLAYVEDHRALSAGTVLSAAMFERAIDCDRVALIDYGTGDDGYKRDWMSERRSLCELTLTDPRHPAGLAWLLRDAAVRLVRHGRAH